MTSVDAASFLVIVCASAAASMVVTALAPRLTIPVVVVELLLGILIGPDGIDLAVVDDFTNFFGNLGLGMLFFFAGYEIDFQRIRGRPLMLALVTWAISLALAYGLGALLAVAGVVLSLLYTGSAMATTAIGTLIPVLKDAGDLRSRFGTYLLGAGAVGEFGPILLLTLALTTANPLNEAVILVAFVVLAVLCGVLAVRYVGRGWPALERTVESSSQLIVRLVVVLIFALLTLASDLGLDLLLGGFVAGLISRMALRGREVELFESKITALGYGFLVPFFFITSGMKFDLSALAGSATALLKVPLFVGLFLIVRGVPAVLLYRRVLATRDRLALAVYSATELPLVVAITTVAVDAGEMRSSTASALVGAGIISTLVFPLIGLRLRAGRTADDDEAPEVVDETYEGPAP
ncbi:MAG: cation:proton antiporter [Actinomycetota bacterium]|nr:cation:proton antiporter [Actinomycetota bacterium]